MDTKPVVVVSSVTKRVLWGSVTGSLPPLVPDAVIIAGDRANLLYTAISGHGMAELPGQASTFKARLARSILAQDRQDPESILVNEVIGQWGEYIRPWFGCHVIDEAGNRLFNLDIYRVVYSLLDNKPGVAVDVEFVAKG